MEHDLPDNFDLIVIGTGMEESVIAAAASRIGKRVLHLDRIDFYGGLWASFNIEGIEKYILKQATPANIAPENSMSFLSEGEHHMNLGNNLYGISDVKLHWHIPKNLHISQEPKVNSIKVANEIETNKDTNPEKVEDLNKIERDGKAKQETVEDHNKIKRDEEGKLENVEEHSKIERNEEAEVGIVEEHNKTEKEEEEKQENVDDHNKIKDDNELDENIEETKNKEKMNEQDDKNKIWSQEKIYQNSRKFNIDLAPKLQFSRGDFIELLISSNIARYCEYRSCTRVLTWINNHLEVVPCSRSDVFSNTNVSVVEKRMLMKILSICMDSHEEFFADYKNKSFLSFLKDKKLTPNLIHYILYAISMSNENTPCLEAIKNTKRFLNSLGRYGKTPFVCSMYGSGELPQAFCRLSAVFGGIYCLNRNINSLILNSENICTSVVCGKQKITSDNIVMSVEYIPEKYMFNAQTEKISRAIFITNKSILNSEKENLTLLIYPPENGKNGITLIELGPSTGTCPQNFYIVHVYCKQLTTPEEDFKHCVEKMLKMSDVKDDETYNEHGYPQVLWSLYFTCTNVLFDEQNLPKNIYSCSGPDLDLDYDHTIRKAKDLFLRIYPEDEFLPRAPDPEEIVLCDEEENENKETNTTSDSLVDTPSKVDQERETEKQEKDTETDQETESEKKEVVSME